MNSVCNVSDFQVVDHDLRRDRIVLAASDDGDWDSDNGNLAVEAISADLDMNNFSHTRAYLIDAGTHTFYAVCENYVETAGNGEASNYGSLSVEFFPGIVTAVGEEDMPSTAFMLEQNYPNPFNSPTRIDFELMRPDDISLKVYDVSGRWVATLFEGRLESGPNHVIWNGRNADGSDVPAGIYYYMLSTSAGRTARKMVLMR